MILLRSFLSGHIRIKRTLEYYDAGIGPRVPFGGGFGPTVSANFAVALGDYSTLSTTSSMPTGGSITRAGNAMVWVNDGGTAKLTWAPANLLTYSNKFDITEWPGLANVTTSTGISAPDGTTSAYIITDNATPGIHRLQRPYTYAASAHTYSLYVKYVDHTFIQLVTFDGVADRYANFNLVTGTVGNKSASVTSLISPVGNGWYRVSMTFTASGGSGNIQVAMCPSDVTSAVPSYAGTGTSLYMFGAQLERVTFQTTPSTYVATTSAAYYGPRFDIDPATLAAKGLLVEGARTNIASYSDDFRDTASAGSTRPWVWGGATVSPNVSATVSPDGTQNADKLQEDTSTGQHYVYQNVTTSNTSTYTVSVYAKAAERNFIYVAAYQVNSVEFCVNLTTGAITNIATGSSGVLLSSSAVSVGNGWFRIAATFSIAASSTTIQFNASTAAGTKSYTGTTGSGVYLFGAQLELGAFASSYLPVPATSSSPTNTRAAESFTLANYQNRLVESFYIDEQTGGSWSANIAPSATSPLTISTPTFGWVTSLRPYTNAYAGDISSPSWIDNNSTVGGRMYYDSTGMLTWAPENILLNSATLSTQSVTTTGTTGGELGTNYVLSFLGTGSVTLSGTGSGTLAGTGASNRVSLAFAATYGTLTLTVTGSVTSAQLERVTYQTSPRAYIPTTSAAVYQPRYDYDPSVTPATPRGMLIEEQRVNLLLYSFFSAGWSQTNTVISVPGNVTAPDGTANAALYSPTAGANNLAFQSVTMPASAAGSIYVKANGAAFFFIRLFDGTNVYYTWFNLTSGTVGTNQNTTASITSVGNGWYRLTVTKSLLAASGNFLIGVCDSDGGAQVASASSKAYIWGAQLEAGSFPTSYIPTTTASVTRVADVVKLSGSALTTLQGSAWSAAVEVTHTSSTSGVFLAGNGYRLLVKQISNTQVDNYNTSVDLIASVGSGSFLSGPVRSLTSNNAFGRSIVANNGTVQSDGGTMPSITTAWLGYNNVSEPYQNGWTRSFAAYNQRLPDTILKQKSTVGSPY